MKTINVTRIIVIGLIVGFISTFSSYAKSPAAMAAQKVQQKISDVVQNMEDPENTPTSGTVVIVFTFNDEGKIEIKKIDSNNDEAENFVVKKISNITYKNFVDPYHKLYKIKFRFDQI
jgi:hypothetical protein